MELECRDQPRKFHDVKYLSGSEVVTHLGQPIALLFIYYTEDTNVTLDILSSLAFLINFRKSQLLQFFFQYSILCLSLDKKFYACHRFGVFQSKTYCTIE